MHSQGLHTLKSYVIVICAPINYINTCATLRTVDSLLLLAVPVNKSLLRAWMVEHQYLHVIF